MFVSIEPLFVSLRSKSGKCECRLCGSELVAPPTCARYVLDGAKRSLPENALYKEVLEVRWAADGLCGAWLAKVA